MRWGILTWARILETLDFKQIYMTSYGVAGLYKVDVSLKNPSNINLYIIPGRKYKPYPPPSNLISNIEIPKQKISSVALYGNMLLVTNLV